MNADRLLAHYERIADAPDAIARLRRFILDLAVRGKLVPQDPSDEPASELLKRIAAHKDRLVKAGEIRSGIPLPRISEKTAPFELPLGWAWARLGGLIYLVSGQHLQPGEYSEDSGAGLPYITGPSDFGPAGLQITRFALVRRAVATRGQLLLTVKGSGVGKIATCDLPEVAISRQLMALTAISWDGRYLVLVTHLLAETLRKNVRSLIPGISRGDVDGFTLGVPPLAEQHRIVAKVDELMALCDRLEAARALREATRDRLATASLARLNAPDPDTFRDDARFALDALPALTGRTDQIKQLRQTILNLAVRGRLVPQDPNDEAVALPTADPDERPPDVPATWCYTRLADVLSEDTRNGYSRRPDDALGGVPILRISAGTIRGDGVVAEDEHKLISGIHSGVRLQYGLNSGDLLACRFNGNKAFVGRLSIFTDYLGLGPIYPDKLIRIRVAQRLCVPAFVRLAGDTDIVRDQVESVCATTVGNWGISASNLKEVRFPVPPLAEQRRIVAKVDELMVLCDRLEAGLATGDDTRRRLLDALLHAALAPSDTQVA